MSKLKMTIVRVIEDSGHIEVMWNDDPTLHWTYEIPLDAAGRPLEGEPLMRALVQNAHPEIARQRARSKADFQRLKPLEGEAFEVGPIFDEIDELLSEDPVEALVTVPDVVA